MIMSWKNLVFNFLLVLGAVYLQIHGHIFNFFLDDSSHISLVLLSLYPLVIIRYSFLGIQEDRWLGRLTDLYRHIAPMMGAIGTVIGMYVIFKEMSVMTISSDNIQAIIDVVVKGIFIDLVPTATSLFILVLMLINKYLYGGIDEEVV